MKSTLKHKFLQLGVNVCRFLLAAAFVFSGFVKLLDPRGTEYKIEDYLALFGLNKFFPLPLPLLMSVLLGLLEFSLGVYLLFGIRRKGTSRATMLFLLVMTPLTLYLALTNPITDCGCFGDAIHLTNWQTFGKNVVLLLACVILYLNSHVQPRLISERNQWVISLYSLAFGVVVALYSIYRLPLIDFRPYHIGIDLPSAIMEEWDNPTEDAHYLDFSMTSAEGDDITFDWLSAPGYKFLLVSPYLEMADDGPMDHLNDIWDYAREQGYPMLCLTSSVDESIQRWRDLTGAEYPFAFADGVVLKTIIRSNPGLLLLRDGLIIGKWPASSLPAIDAAKGPLDEQSIGQFQPEKNLRTILYLVLWFVVPLLLCTFVDGIWVGRKKYERRKNRNKINSLTN